jgi:hypothetical protein
VVLQVLLGRLSKAAARACPSAERDAAFTGTVACTGVSVRGRLSNAAAKACASVGSVAVDGEDTERSAGTDPTIWGRLSKAAACA